MSKKNNFSVPVNQLTKSYRTKFDMSHQVKGSFNHGLLIPFDVIECLPGDTFKIDLASIIRMSTPIAPIMDNIHMHVAAYFVPNRIVYDNWEQLMGVNKSGAWLTDTSTYAVPYCVSGSSAISQTILPQSIGDYMGLPLSSSGQHVNALPGRGYAMIWNEYYRSPVVSAPLPVDHSSNNKVLVSDVSNSDRPVIVGSDRPLTGVYFYSGNVLPLAKYADYFTKCLPQPIKHEPIAFIPDDLKVGYPYDDTYSTTQSSVIVPAVTAGSEGFNQIVTGAGAGGKDLVASVDATWNTIEALRTAFQLDKFYYKDSYARNYRDMLLAHFDVDNNDAVMQIPQKIGELRWQINVDQVLSTAGYAATSSTTVGAPGANSVTTGRGSLTTFSCTEHGFIIIVGGTRHDHTYAQGYKKMWSRSDRLDFYDPVFANIGDQPVGKEEIYAASGATDPFGYQEAWAEYRFVPDRACGVLNPNASGSLDFWTLTDSFAAQPILNEAFIYENRNSIARALVTSTSGPDYIFDFYFKVTAVREMPLFSIPGLADHH